jgi:alkylation response protein AidB-like acyl-CoA dehydrogenase
VAADSERIRLRYGEMRIAAYAARSMVYRTARLTDAGHDTVNESIAAKVFATEVAGQIADSAIQLVGGEALVVGHPLEAAVRRLRTLRLAEGETDTLRVNVSRGHLDLGKGRI